MKNITIAGRITRDAEIRNTNGGDPVCNFNVAVDDRSTKEKATIFFSCSLWGKRGESLSQYLTKGSSVAVSGDLGTREHEGKTYLTVKANDVTLQGGKSQDDREAVKSHDRGRDESLRNSRGNSARETYDPNDDIPF